MSPQPVLLVILLVCATQAPLALGAVPAGRIAYIVGGGYGDLYVLDLTTGTTTQVPLPGIGAVGFPNWSSSGDLLAFNDISNNIYTVRPDGSDLFYVTHAPSGGEPSFSPDSSEIVFYAIAGGWRLHTANADGTNRTNLGVVGVHARWSPVEPKIAYSEWSSAPVPYRSDIFIYDLTTSTSTQITAHAPNQGFVRVAWSPDGSMLAVSEIDHSAVDYDIWVMNADGSNPINLTSDWDTSREDYPSWSSDGQFIVFSSNRSGNSDIWAMHPDGSGRVNLTNTPEDEFSPWIGPPTCPEDSDGDGVPDDVDNCPNSDLGGVLVIDGCDTEVPNQLFSDGCSMADLGNECADGTGNHGAFVICVAQLAKDWKQTDLITGQQKGRIQSCAAQADIWMPCQTDADCNDGLFCNGVEICLEGDCVVGDPCPGQGCDEVDDVCVE